MSREKSETEQQFQFLEAELSRSPISPKDLTRTSLKRPRERVAKERRVEREAGEREGKGRATAPSGISREEEEEGKEESGEAEEEDDGEGEGEDG